MSSRLPIERSVIDQLTLRAKILSDSRLVPAVYRKRPEDILAVSLRGAAYGWDEWTSMANFNIIGGKPTLTANAMIGLAMEKHPKAEIRYEETEGECKIHAKRNSELPSSTFTWNMGMAKRAGLLGKDNWIKYPQDMLRSRAQATMVRALFPDALLGSIYTHEEMNPDRAVNREGEIIIEAEGTVINGDSNDDISGDESLSDSSHLFKREKPSSTDSD